MSRVTLQTNIPIRAVQVTDALGRDIPVPTCTVPPSGARGLSGVRGLCISTWKPGLYQVKIHTAEGTALQRVVKR